MTNKEQDYELKAVSDAIVAISALGFCSMIGIGLNENLRGEDYDRLAGIEPKSKKRWWQLIKAIKMSQTS